MYPCCPSPPILLASICVNDGIILASFILYSKSLSTGFISMYRLSNSVRPRNGSISSNDLISFPDIQRSVNDVKCAKGDVSVRRFLVISIVLNCVKGNANPVSHEAPKTSIALCDKYNSSRVSTWPCKFSILVNRLDCKSSLRSFVSLLIPLMCSILFLPSHNSSRFSRPDISSSSNTRIRLAPRSIFRSSFKFLIPVMLFILFCAIST